MLYGGVYLLGLPNKGVLLCLSYSMVLHSHVLFYSAKPGSAACPAAGEVGRVALEVSGHAVTLVT